MLVMKFPKSQEHQLVPSQVCQLFSCGQASQCQWHCHEVLILHLYLSPQYCFVNQIKNLMFTWGLNKFYCNYLCDRFKIISTTKTWYQTPEKVAQIQGQDDKFSAKSCQISGVGRIYFNWNKTSQVVFGLEKISANLHCSLALSDPLLW